ncbi:acyl-CoA dehydrogenase family protein [Streptomyces sp. ST2-7A]|uniref:acyl-CoA dehydrogenase family protein n=1 Tax=Streptomyces sp. ST2-7A TaxID=2907214 RepID=UPI001F3F67DC|nr:acyl-CoA dehydrogenase family protein [Streptomyces sp. ST2-7A]MCE7079515.1 acyl-CoA dehydrogenase family protein [Streptomyces sp. ST2-7A]
MTTTSTGTVTGAPPLPEPDLTEEEAIARARSIAVRLVERQGETEERGYYAADLHEEFRDAGFYRVLVPRRYGGYEFGPSTFMRIATELARGCPSTAWMYLFGAAHALVAGTLFDEEVQDELFAEGDFICPATVAPSGSATRTDHGWLIEGTWGYCSGAPYATHFIGHTLVPGPDPDGPPLPLMFVVPSSAFERLDDWGDQLGLRGSGSHSIRLNGVVVPDRHTLVGHLSRIQVTDDTPGRALHGPYYGGGPLGFMLLELGVLATGMARGALDAYADLMRARSTSFPPIVPRTEDPDYQLRFGTATGMIAAADAAMTDAVRQWEAMCEEGAGAFTRERELRLALISREAVRLAWRAVEGQLLPTAGSGAIRRGERLERVWRDLSTVHSHLGNGVFLATHANRELAMAHFGLLP